MMRFSCRKKLKKINTKESMKMKTSQILIAVLAITLFAGSIASAQTWRPFGRMLSLRSRVAQPCEPATVTVKPCVPEITVPPCEPAETVCEGGYCPAPQRSAFGGFRLFGR
jgi:hypothetical protein